MSPRPEGVRAGPERVRPSPAPGIAFPAGEEAGRPSPQFLGTLIRGGLALCASGWAVSFAPAPVWALGVRNFHGGQTGGCCARWSRGEGPVQCADSTVPGKAMLFGTVLLGKWPLFHTERETERKKRPEQEEQMWPPPEIRAQGGKRVWHEDQSYGRLHLSWDVLGSSSDRGEGKFTSGSWC